MFMEDTFKHYGIYGYNEQKHCYCRSLKIYFFYILYNQQSQSQNAADVRLIVPLYWHMVYLFPHIQSLETFSRAALWWEIHFYSAYFMK